MSTFDADLFLHTTHEEANETAFLPIPEGEYEALVDNIKVGPLKDWTVLKIQWDILSEELRVEFDQPKVIASQSVFLDLDDNGLLKFGPNANVQLGRLREALGQNTGQPWSLNDLKGAGPAYIRIIHTPNEKTPDSPHANVNGVASSPGG